MTVAQTELVPPGKLALRLAGLRLGDDGTPVPDVVLVDLDDIAEPVPPLSPTAVVVGVAHRPLSPVAQRISRKFACTLVPSGAASSVTEIAVPDPLAAALALADAVRLAPRAAVSLVNLLRLTSRLPTAEGLAAESAVYSMLLAGTEFASWLAGRPSRGSLDDAGRRLRVQRTGDRLDVALDRPHRRNAFDRAMRDALVEAFEFVLADPSVAAVTLRGLGPAFCAGGDLAEFGRSADVSTAHLIRLERSVAALVERCSDRVTAHLHGACIGAGIEIPSFAGRIVASAGTFFQLPEVAMGLVPGAGGTVGITHRIGRWRTAYLALSGVRLDADAALEWGLVDAVDD